MNKHLFSTILTSFLSDFLPNGRNVSENTVSSYCDTYKLLLRFLRDIKNIKLEKLLIEQLNNDLIKEFLQYLETERNCSPATLNQRLNAIRSLFKYIASEYPDLALQCNRIMQIKKRKTIRPNIGYLDEETLKNILKKPDITEQMGIRDLAILCVCYDTGARVQEIVNLTVKDLRLENPPKIRLFGKGNKYRFVPLMPNTVAIIRKYLNEFALNEPNKLNHKLFFNRNSDTITRAGIAYILNKYCRDIKTIVGTNISPHILRHSKAMHLLQAGVNIIYIKEILGHEDVNTTQVYAQADLRMKTSALEKASNLIPQNITVWQKDKDLLVWLDNFQKQRTATIIM